jgi:hypothetical protein
MLNLVDDSRDVIFLDVDGTLVIHNYDPENKADVFIYSTLEFLDLHRDKLLVLTTSRKEEHVLPVVDTMSCMGFKVDRIIHSLPTGKRIIVNDNKPNFPKKAVELPILRDVGVDKCTQI